MAADSSRVRLAVLVAGAALFGAVVGSPLAGVAASATHKISGSTIKKGSITGTKLKNNTVTGKQVKESTLTGVVQGSANEVQFRVTKPPSTATFNLFSLQDGGLFTASCSSGTQPVLTFKNTTGKSQDLTLTQDSAGSTTVSVFGPPFGPGGAVGLQLSAFNTYVTAVSQTAPLKTAQLTVLAGVDAGSCFWDVVGQSSLAITP
jgi:hypothetical protein